MIVYYKDSEDREITESESLSGNLGETYSDNAKEIPEYCFSKTIGEVKRLFSEKSQGSTYVYPKIIIPISEFTITFDSEGASPINNQKVKKNQTVTLPAVPLKVGYTFMEWQLAGKSFNFATKITSDITLKEKYRKDEAGITKKTTNN